MKGQNLGNWIAEREAPQPPEAQEASAEAVRELLRRRRKRRIVVTVAAAAFILTVVLAIRKVSQYRRMVSSAFSGAIAAIEFQPYPGKGFVRIEDQSQIQWIRQALGDAIPEKRSALDTPCELRILRQDGSSVTMRIGAAGPSVGPNGALNLAGTMIDLQWGWHRRTINSWGLTTAYQSAPDPKPQPDPPTTGMAVVSAPRWGGLPGSSQSLDPFRSAADDLRERVEWLTKEKAFGAASFLLGRLLAQHPGDAGKDLRPKLDSSIRIRLASLLAQAEIGLSRDDGTLDRAVYLRHRDELLEATWLAPAGDERVSGLRARLEKRRPSVDLSKLIEVQALKGDAADFFAIRDVAWSLDNTRLAAACSDGMIRLWDAQSGHLVLRLKAEPGYALKFLPDHRRVLVAHGAGQGQRQAVWDLASGTETTSAPQREPATALRPTRDGGLLLSAFPSDSPVIWQLAEEPPKVLDPLSVGRKAVADAVMSADGSHLALMGEGPRRWLALHDVGRSKTAEIGTIDWTAIAGFSADGAHLIAAQAGAPMRVWNVASGEPADASAIGGRVFSDQFARDALAVVQPMGWRVVIFDAGTGSEITSLRHTAPVSKAFFSPDGDQIITQTPTSLHIWSNAY